MAILETKDLCKTYGSGENEVKALDHVSIGVEEGKFISVIGTSGSGKSTLLNMLGGLDRPTNGTVLVSGKEIFQMQDEELTIFRRRNIGFVFQNYNLIPVLNVYENIVFPIELDGSKLDKSYVEHIIQTLGLAGKQKAEELAEEIETIDGITNVGLNRSADVNLSFDEKLFMPFLEQKFSDKKSLQKAVATYKNSSSEEEAYAAPTIAVSVEMIKRYNRTPDRRWMWSVLKKERSA